MIEDLVAFVESLDRCWLERRFDDLAAHLASDVVMVSPQGHRIEGLAAAAKTYREFMNRAEIEHFASRDHDVTIHGTTAVADYRWDMAWRDSGTHQQAGGRELLVLNRGADGWRVVWRTQLQG